MFSHYLIGNMQILWYLMVKYLGNFYITLSMLLYLFHFIFNGFYVQNERSYYRMLFLMKFETI